MLFSTAGVAATGVGASPIGIDGAVPAALSSLVAGAQYGPPWISTNEIVFQDCTSSCILEKYHKGTTALTTLSANGSNTQGAGNGIWALARVGAGLITNNAAGNFPAGWLGDVSPNGELGVILTYPELNGLRVYSSTGTALITNLDTVQLAVGLMRIRGNVLAYQAMSGWHLVSTVGASIAFAPRTDDTVGWITPIRTAGGALYVMERSDRLTVRLSDAASGYEIASVGTFTYNPDALEVSTGVLQFGWCSSQGETADSLFVAKLTLATGGLQLYGVSGGSLVLVSSTTLSPVTFSVGPVEGSAGGVLALPNDQQTIIQKNGASSPPMRKWMMEVSRRVAGNTQAISNIPPPSAAVSFGTITSGTDNPVVASKAADTLDIEAGSGVTITTDPVTKTLTVAATGSGGTVTTSGAPASGNLTKFSAATVITNGDLSGDVTTSGALATTIATNAVTTTKINNTAVTLAKIQNATANSRLLGSGSSGSGASYSELSLGSGISISGTTVSATGTVLQSTVSLTNAQVISLPGTPITIVSAPGANLRIKILGASMVLRSTGHAYSGVSATFATLVLQVPTGEWLVNPLVNDNSLGTPLADLTGWLESGATLAYDFIVPFVAAVYDTGGANLWTNTIINTQASSVGNALVQLALDNNGSSSNLGGGDASNSLRVTVTYAIETV